MLAAEPRSLVKAPRLHIGGVRAAAYTIPTDRPESDGTLEWRSTTMVVAHLESNGRTGMGYTYTDVCAAGLIRGALSEMLTGHSFVSPVEAWRRMQAGTRNLGFCGVVSAAVSALDFALWDVWAQELSISTALALGASRASVPVYGSGGFTSYSVFELQDQLASWVAMGIPRAKMKVGRRPAADGARVRAARAAIGEDAELFVDANGGYSVEQALALAHRFAEDAGVSWLEEPRPASDIDGTRRVRDGAPAGLEIAGGEYTYTTADARALAGCLDVLQSDVTRCGGFTGFLQVAALAESLGLPMSAHCAPALSARVALAAPVVRHIEYFHDHARIEARFLDGAEDVVDGRLHPDTSIPGLGLALKEPDLARFVVG